MNQAIRKASTENEASPLRLLPLWLLHCRCTVVLRGSRCICCEAENCRERSRSRGCERELAALGDRDTARRDCCYLSFSCGLLGRHI